MHRSVWLLAVVVAVTGVFLATPALAGKGGNSGNAKGGNSANARGGDSAHAKACQKGGWMKLVRSDQTSFKNQGACVSLPSGPRQGDSATGCTRRTGTISERRPTLR